MTWMSATPQPHTVGCTYVGRLDVWIMYTWSFSSHVFFSSPFEYYICKLFCQTSIHPNIVISYYKTTIFEVDTPNIFVPCSRQLGTAATVTDLSTNPKLGRTRRKFVLAHSKEHWQPFPTGSSITTWSFNTQLSHLIINYVKNNCYPGIEIWGRNLFCQLI